MTSNSSLSLCNVKQVCGYLLEHALHYDQPRLVDAINVLLPDLPDTFTPPEKDLLLLHAILIKFRRTGPLPEILHATFLHTLHESLIGFVRVHPALFAVVDRISVAKVVCMIRYLLISAVLHSSSYTAADVMGLVKSYFPRLPTKGASRGTAGETKVAAIEALFSLSEVEESEKNKLLEMLTKSYNKAHHRFSNHLSSIEKLGEERRRDPKDTVIKIFEAAKGELWKIGDYVCQLLPPTALEQLRDGFSPDIPELFYLTDIMKGRNVMDETTMLDVLHGLVGRDQEKEFWERIGDVRQVVKRRGWVAREEQQVSSPERQRSGEGWFVREEEDESLLTQPGLVELPDGTQVWVNGAREKVVGDSNEG